MQNAQRATEKPESADTPTITREMFNDVVTKLCADHPKESGFNLLKTGGEALTARRVIIQNAKESLDLQYYIVQDDLSGKLLIEDILRAADRGVKTRILLDDLDFRRARLPILILDNHENIEIRIFNPAITRRQRWVNKLFRFSRFFERYSKRMHNKALLVDGRLAVVGGRNLGDQYFDARAPLAFNDLDVLVMGPIVKDICECFKKFWNAEAAHTLPELEISLPPAKTIAVHRRALSIFYEDVANMRVVSPKRPEYYTSGIYDGSLPISWAEAEFVADAPDKVFVPLDEADSPPMRKLEEMLAEARHEFVGVSPYFIPGTYGTHLLRDLIKRGVRVQMLTNSLASTDISAVHAAYSRYRGKMLDTGVELFELTPIAGHKTRHNLLRKGSSRSSLHAKVYVIDKEWVMIGSMNLDPRSWRRNTESVVTVRSASLAAEILEMFDDITDQKRSYAVSKDKHGKLQWRGEENGKIKCFDHEPHPGWFRRIACSLFYHLAPEDQL